jgi:hypothetical protein
MRNGPVYAPDKQRSAIDLRLVKSRTPPASTSMSFRRICNGQKLGLVRIAGGLLRIRYGSRTGAAMRKRLRAATCCAGGIYPPHVLIVQFPV